MKNTVFKVATILIATLFLTSCAHYDIEPKYNSEDKSLTINHIKLENFKEKSKTHHGHGGRGSSNYIIKNFHSNNEECNEIHFNASIAGHHTYFIKSH